MPAGVWIGGSRQLKLLHQLIFFGHFRSIAIYPWAGMSVYSSAFGPGYTPFSGFGGPCCRPVEEREMNGVVTRFTGGEVDTPGSSPVSREGRHWRGSRGVAFCGLLLLPSWDLILGRRLYRQTRGGGGAARRGIQ